METTYRREALTVRVIFCTSGDSAETIADVLTGAPTSASFFSVFHDLFYSQILAPRVTLKLCLPARRPGNGTRCSPVLVLRTDASVASGFLGGRPLEASDIKYMLLSDQTAGLFKPLLEIIGGARAPPNQDACTFQSQVAWLRTKFVTALRKLYKMTPSPYWMLSAFGAQEAQFVLTSSFYFFEHTVVCTTETVSHLSRLFSPQQGQTLVSVTSHEELGQLYGTSPFRRRVPAFVAYVKEKLARDSLETEAIDRTIDQIRGKLMLSNQDLVHFIYISFYQCLNKRAFLRYSRQTSSSSAIRELGEDPQLCGALHGEFRDHVQSYYHKKTYLSTYIDIRYVGGVLPDGYFGGSLVGERCVYWCGQSKDTASLLATISQQVPHLRLQNEFAGMLDVAALRGSDDGQFKEGLFSHSQALPLYRCEFLGKQFFTMLQEDGLERYWEQSVIFPGDQDWDMLSDKDLTYRIFYHDLSLSLPTLKEQLLVSRHEYFNPRLPVYRWVLDFDLPVCRDIDRTFEEVHSLCCSLREAILDIIQLLGPVDPRTHPVYFFKSACPPDEWRGEDVASTSFCRCHDKLGMRIIVPFPEGVCVVGSEPMVALTGILNRTIKLDPELVHRFPSIQKKGGPFDCGIYGRGRSVRLPHCYKVGLVGELCRLLKILVCHPAPNGKAQYVRRAFTLRELLHHSPGHSAGHVGRIIYSIMDRNENFLENKTISYLPAKIPHIFQRIETLSGRSIEDWLHSAVWDKAYDTICKFFPDEKAQQFSHVAFTQQGENIIQLRPRQGRHFLCINHNHKNKSKTVRVFLTLHSIRVSEVTVTLMSQCFASKCNNNVPTAHFSFVVPVGLAS